MGKQTNPNSCNKQEKLEKKSHTLLPHQKLIKMKQHVRPPLSQLWVHCESKGADGTIVYFLLAKVL